MSTSQITSNGYRDHSEYRKDNFNTKISLNLNEDTKLTLVANYVNQPYTDDPQALTPNQFKQDPKQSIASSYTGNTRVTREQTYGGVILDHNISETQTFRLMTYYGERSNLQYLPTAASGFKRDFGGADLRWTYKDTLFAKPFTFAAGMAYDMMEDDRKRWSTSNGQKTILRRDEMQKAWNVDQYAQATFEPTDRWLLIAGMRHSKIKMNVDDKYLSNDTGDDGGSLEYSNTSPVLGATFKVTPTFNLYANYGEGFETPTFAEMSYSNAATGAGPNLTMKPSKTKNYEVGAKAFITDNTRINLALFKIDSNNEITVDENNTTTNFTSYKSVAKTERKGLELSIDSRLPYNFSFYGAYTLMDAEFKNNFCGGLTCSASTTVSSGNKIPGTYTATTYSELMWKYPAYGFSTALEAIYVSATNAYDSNIGVNPFSATTRGYGSFRSDSNTLFNLRAGFTQQVGNWKLTEFARIDNLSDQSYVSSIKVNSAQAFEPGPGRNYMLGVSAAYMFQ